ncbi:MAG: RnfABCDGE type electron transport complex subunit A [Dehalococcoidales bacterium]|mgnify:CR=1 FL=1|nr:RnfABCDGE type electron transport complex subunit A [Dehalococcoidales bacterium]
MSDNLVIVFLTMALINNFILVKFLGLCPFFGISKNIGNALSMGIAVTLVMTLASAVTWVIDHFILKQFDIEYMSIVMFILVIAVMVQIVEMVIKRTNLTLYNALGIYLPLITTNCAVLGIALLNQTGEYSFITSIVAALGGGVGFLVVLLIMSGIRERLDLADIPKAMKGLPVAFMVAVLLGLTFIGFGGIV